MRLNRCLNLDRDLFFDNSAALLLTPHSLSALALSLQSRFQTVSQGAYASWQCMQTDKTPRQWMHSLTSCKPTHMRTALLTDWTRHSHYPRHEPICAMASLDAVCCVNALNIRRSHPHNGCIGIQPHNGCRLTFKHHCGALNERTCLCHIAGE